MPLRSPARRKLAALVRLITGSGETPPRSERATALARLKLSSLQAMNA